VLGPSGVMSPPGAKKRYSSSIIEVLSRMKDLVGNCASILVGGVAGEEYWSFKPNVILLMRGDGGREAS
jgi:hypothetical protein